MNEKHEISIQYVVAIWIGLNLMDFSGCSVDVLLYTIVALLQYYLF